MLATQEIDLIYTLIPKNDKICVTLTLQNNENEITEIEIPDFFDSDIIKKMSNIQCFLEDKEYNYDTKNEKIIQVFHRPKEKIKIQYSLVLKTNIYDEKNPFKNYPQPQILSFFGDRFLLAPKISSEEKLKVYLEWKDFPSNWEVISSFGIGKKLEFTATSFQFFQSIFSIGNLNIKTKSIMGNNLYIATPYNNSPFLDRLEDLVSKVVYEQRKMWQDNNFPFFFMLHIPHENENEIYGEAKLNGFVVSSKNIDQASEENWQSLSWVICHEHFHTWLPYKMLRSMEKNFDDLAWLIEGFTEYYAAVTAYETGVLNIKQIMKEVNHMIYSYYSSPVINASNKNFIENRYISYEMQKLPYQKGFILAMLWNEQIQSNNLINSSINDFMLRLIDLQKDDDYELSSSILSEIAAQCIDQDAFNDIQDYIIDGYTLPLPQYVLGHRCKTEWITQFDNKLIPQLQLEL